MNAMIDELIDSLIRESTTEHFSWNVENIRTGKPKSWNYIDGCMFNSFLELSKSRHDPKLQNFVKDAIDSYLDDAGNIMTYDYHRFALDDICESRVLFTLYERFKDGKYQKAIEHTYEQIRQQPRTEEGNFWHKLIYPNQVWLDGLYMVMPFYIRYLNMQGDYEYSDLFRQYQNVYRLMYDSSKGLYYHGYDASKSIFWADRQTGLSQSFWLRSIGWYLVSMVDVLEYSQNVCLNEYLKTRIRELVDGLMKYQDQKSKMFYQVVDHPDGPGNYLETSGSAMIAYAMLKGVRLEALDHSYLDQGKKVFDGICRKYLSLREGKLHLGGICLVAGLGPSNNPRRDGSHEYYLSEPVVEDDAKGVAPFIMAYVEMQRRDEP